MCCHLPSRGIHKSKKQIKYMYLLKETKASKSTACRHCLSFNSPRPFVGLLKCVVLLFYKQCCVTVFTVYSTMYVYVKEYCCNLFSGVIIAMFHSKEMYNAMVGNVFCYVHVHVSQVITKF